MPQSRLVQTGLADALVAWERRHGGLRRDMLAMLAGWLGYFLLVHMFVRSLNKIVVPVLDLPLGVVLAAHGAFAVFIIALVLLARHSSEG